MKSIRTTVASGVVSATLLLALAAPATAGSVSGLTTFTANTTAKASEVNGNFTAVQTAVNDNDSRITNLQSNPSISGNLTLPDSTDANTGNIVKGSTVFLHNFGTYNTFLGAGAGNFTMGGINNTGLGFQALQTNTSGNNNTAVGSDALDFNAGGNDNTATGVQALASNTTGSGNTANGSVALMDNTTGSANTASGYQALWANTIGNNNTATGYQALEANAAGTDNTANGYQALTANTSGTGNTANGYSALSYLTNGYDNTATGALALEFNAGNGNTASGSAALEQNTSGIYNTAIGAHAADSNTTGSENIAIGQSAGNALTTGSYNIDIGNYGNAAEANTIRIGDTNQTSTFIAGINGTTVTGTTVVVDSNGQLGVATSSRRFKDHIRPMADASSVLNKLHPVTFYYKIDHDPKGRHLQYGLVAEDVAKVAPALVSYGKDGKPQAVYYRFLAPMLLNQYQKQQKLIAEQGARIGAQQTALNAQAMLLRTQTREIVALKTQARQFKRQAVRMAVLEKQMARINTILAMRKGSATVASAGSAAQ